jgi:hypothetical protein
MAQTRHIKAKQTVDEISWYLQTYQRRDGIRGFERIEAGTQYIISSIRGVAQWKEHRSYKSGAVHNGIHGFESHLPDRRIRIAVGYGTGLAATLKTIQLGAQANRALAKAKADADIKRILSDIKRERDREVHAIRFVRRPVPSSRADPSLDNWITK